MPQNGKKAVKIRDLAGLIQGLTAVWRSPPVLPPGRPWPGDPPADHVPGAAAGPISVVDTGYGGHALPGTSGPNCPNPVVAPSSPVGNIGHNGVLPAKHAGLSPGR